MGYYYALPGLRYEGEGEAPSIVCFNWPITYKLLPYRKPVSTSWYHRYLVRRYEEISKARNEAKTSREYWTLDNYRYQLGRRIMAILEKATNDEALESGTE